MRHSKYRGFSALALLLLSGCADREPTPIAVPAPSSFEEEIQFKDGSVAVLQVDVKGDKARGYFTSGDIEIQLQGGFEKGLTLRAFICLTAEKFEIVLPEYPESISGSILYQGLATEFQRAQSPEMRHRVEGQWSISVTNSVSSDETRYISGDLSLRGHEDLTLSAFSFFQFEVTGGTDTGGIEGKPITDAEPCPLAGVLRGSALALGEPFLNFMFSQSFTSAVVWADNATGTASKRAE